MEKIKILIVEDDINSFKILKQSLEVSKIKDEIEIYPSSEELIKEFCEKLQDTNNSNDVYEYLIEKINEFDIDFVILDFLLSKKETNAVSDINYSTGKNIIDRIKGESNFLRYLPIASCTRLLISNQNKDFKNVIFYIEKKEDVNSFIDYWKRDQKQLYQLIFEAEKYKQIKKNIHDVVFITALEKEYSALKEIFECNGEIKISGITGYSTQINSHKVFIYCMQKMGIVEACYDTFKLINIFNPKLVCMTGIAAGMNRESQNYGDILIPKKVWNWSKGKISNFFEPEIDQIYNNSISITPEIKLNIINNLNDKMRQLNIENFADINPNIQKIFKENMVSGSTVVANEDVKKYILSQDRKISGLDMEAYGVAYAARANNIEWLVIKTIVDFADSEKSDKFHKYGCYSSAYIAKYLLENIILNES